MPWKNAMVAAALLVSSAQAACMTDAPSDSCSVDGAQYFLADGDEAAICQHFGEEFRTALGENRPDGGFGGFGDFAYAITISKSGSVSARITHTSGDDRREFPEITVDVMDRSLDYRDIAQLAQAAAQIVTTNRPGA